MAHLILTVLCLTFLPILRLRAQLSPASIPLAIRSPYMNVWSAPGLPLSNSTTRYWDQSYKIGWFGAVRIDGLSYTWLGQGNFSIATVLDVQITPTRSIFHLRAGAMNLTVTFLSPIEPSDWIRQSLPFSYLYVEATSLDGHPHTVQIYSEINLEWVSVTDTNSVRWMTQNTGKSIYHEVELQSPVPYTENFGRAQDGKAYYAMVARPGMTWQINASNTTREQFSGHGTLTNTEANVNSILYPNIPVFAIAVDLGNIVTTQSPVVWTVGYVRDPVVQYATLSGVTEQRRPYFVTQFPDIGDAIDVLTEEFPAALNRSTTLDSKIIEEASRISAQYADLVSLSTRQTFGSFDITVSADSEGNPNVSDVKIFMKDIGTSTRVTPVERLFAAFPAFLYHNASIGGTLLAPLLELQDGLYDQPYAMQDLGDTYPKAQLILGAHNARIEQTGNMLIMTYAQARYSGDGTLLARHYNLTKRWADYLVDNTLTPAATELNADGESMANITNLALKGIIGVKAMAEISRAIGQGDDAVYYESRADELISTWHTYGRSTDDTHMLGVYNRSQTWALLYNWYADRILGTNLIPTTLSDKQTAFYRGLLDGAPPFGLLVDSFASRSCSSAWTLFTAATVTDDTVRDGLISTVWKKAALNGTVGPFPDRYDDNTGASASRGGTAGPALGAMYALLALTVPNVTITLDPNGGGSGGADGGDGDPGSGPRANTGTKGHLVGPIVGSILGIVALAAVSAGVFFYRRNRRARAHAPSAGKHRYDDDFDGLDGALSPRRLTVMRTTSLSANSASPTYLDRSEGVSYPRSARARSEAGLSGQATLAASGIVGDRPPIIVTLGDPSVLKTRERERNTACYVPVRSGSPVASYITASAANVTDFPASYRAQVGLPGPGGSPPTVVSEVVVEGLRNEMEHLRRVVMEMREQRIEPPPTYAG